MTIPDVFRCNGQSFHVLRDLNAEERSFEQIPDDRYLVRNATKKDLLEEYKSIGEF